MCENGSPTHTRKMKKNVINPRRFECAMMIFLFFLFRFFLLYYQDRRASRLQVQFAGAFRASRAKGDICVAISMGSVPAIKFGAYKKIVRTTLKGHFGTYVEY